MCSVSPIGDLHNPEEFNYGVEAWEAWKNGCLSEDLIEEQKKVKEADLLIFQVIIFQRTPARAFTFYCTSQVCSCSDSGPPIRILGPGGDGIPHSRGSWSNPGRFFVASKGHIGQPNLARSILPPNGYVDKPCAKSWTAPESRSATQHLTRQVLQRWVQLLAIGNASHFLQTHMLLPFLFL